MLSAMRKFPLIICLIIGVVGLAGSISAAAPNDEDTVAAVFPPWWSASHAFTAASGTGAIVNGGTFPFVVIVQSKDPGLAARLRAAGALLLLSPLGLGGCLNPARSQDV